MYPSERRAVCAAESASAWRSLAGLLALAGHLDDADVVENGRVVADQAQAALVGQPVVLVVAQVAEVDAEHLIAVDQAAHGAVADLDAGGVDLARLEEVGDVAHRVARVAAEAVVAA